MSTIAEKLGLNERAFHILFSMFLVLAGFVVNEFRHANSLSQEQAQELIDKALETERRSKEIEDRADANLQLQLQNTLGRLEQNVTTLSSNVATLNVSVAKLEVEIKRKE